MMEEEETNPKNLTQNSETNPPGSIGKTCPIKDGRQYKNPWDTWKFFGKRDTIKWFSEYMTNDTSKVPKDEKELDNNLPIIKPDFELLKSPPASSLHYLWIGHASCLIQMDGITILTDPIFSDRCSFVQFAGTKRYRRPACLVKDIPEVNAVVISHNHYDHLDTDSVKDLNRKFGGKIHWFVPEGLKKWMCDTGCKNVSELSWWGTGTVTNSSGVNVEFVFTPAQHWCQRGVLDRNKVLWGSWCIIGPSKRFFFAGDTGYCSIFKEIGQKYGPFNCAAIPIGAYHPRWFMRPQHVDPEEAVQIHQDVKSLQSYGIHWGTFTMTTEPYMEPKELLEKSMKDNNLDPGTFCTVYHGDVKTVENTVGPTSEVLLEQSMEKLNTSGKTSATVHPENMESIDNTNTKEETATEPKESFNTV